MALPSEKRFIEKLLLAIAGNKELWKAYLERFLRSGSSGEISNKASEIADFLTSAYGGYALRRKLIESVPINPNDCVLDIGPDTGVESFLLAEVYNRVLVAEPDATIPGLLREIAKYYRTEDGRKASEVLDIQRAGIIPPGLTLPERDPNWKPEPPVEYDIRGAPDVSNIFGLHFADRVFCYNIGTFIPAEPQLLILLKALSSYCGQRGVITWCDQWVELDDRGERPLSELKARIVELLPDFTVRFRMFDKGWTLLTIAKRNNYL